MHFNLSQQNIKASDGSILMVWKYTYVFGGQTIKKVDKGHHMSHIDL